uniref:Uncharacterized protein n=1 Tax=Ditylenchus dipsaci TaxID=166011 RepID=A0A915DCK6_9BILA
MVHPFIDAVLDGTAQSIVLQAFVIVHTCCLNQCQGGRREIFSVTNSHICFALKISWAIFLGMITVEDLVGILKGFTAVMAERQVSDTSQFNLNHLLYPKLFVFGQPLISIFLALAHQHCCLLRAGLRFFT